MIIWINGTFGAGKSLAAYELARRLDGAVVCDPEQVGFGLFRMTPRDLRGDFQNQPAWRQGVHDVLATVSGAGRVAIAPMTLTDPGHRAEIVDRLRAAGHRLDEIVLEASAPELRRRLRQRRAAWFGRDTWALAQITVRPPLLARLPDVTRIDTDRLDHDEVVEAIAAACGLPLTRSRHPAPWRPVRRLITQVRLVRL